MIGSPDILIPITIAHSSRLQLSTDSATSLTAVVDTGAHRTVISEKLAARLGFQKIGEVRIVKTVAAEVIECNQYLVDVLISGDISPSESSQSIVSPDATIRFSFVRAIAIKDDDSITCLIGMDILRHCHLMYDGPTHRITIEYRGDEEYSRRNNVTIKRQGKSITPPLLFVHQS